MQPLQRSSSLLTTDLCAISFSPSSLAMAAMLVPLDVAAEAPVAAAPAVVPAVVPAPLEAPAANIRDDPELWSQLKAHPHARWLIAMMAVGAALLLWQIRSYLIPLLVILVVVLCCVRSALQYVGAATPKVNGSDAWRFKFHATIDLCQNAYSDPAGVPLCHGWEHVATMAAGGIWLWKRIRAQMRCQTERLHLRSGALRTCTRWWRTSTWSDRRQAMQLLLSNGKYKSCLPVYYSL
jgi:hypothetical protein